jgi:hypothetical protein
MAKREPQEQLIDELLAALEDVTSWAGKDKRRMAKRTGRTKLDQLAYECQSLNRAAAAILKSRKHQEHRR